MQRYIYSFFFILCSTIIPSGMDKKEEKKQEQSFAFNDLPVELQERCLPFLLDNKDAQSSKSLLPLFRVSKSFKNVLRTALKMTYSTGFWKECEDGFLVRLHPVHNAVFSYLDNKSLDPINILVSLDVNFNRMATPDGYTPLHFAAAYGDSIITKALLDAKAIPTLPTLENVTPLHAAHNKDIAQLLIDAKACVDCIDSQGHTPLHTLALQVIEAPTLEPAQQRKFNALAQFYKTQGIDSKKRNQNGLTAMDYIEALFTSENISQEERNERVALVRDVFSGFI